MWRRCICQHPIVKCAFRKFREAVVARPRAARRVPEARRAAFCSRSQGPVAAVFSPSGSGGRPIRFFGRRSIVFLFPRRVRALGFQRLLPSSRCNTAHRVRRHVKSWFGAMSASHLVPVSGLVYRGAVSEHSASARFASSASPGERFKVTARSSALLHSAYCLSWRWTSP